MRHILFFSLSFFEEKYSDFLQLTNKEKEDLINDYFEKIDKELQSQSKSTIIIENKHITLVEVAENDSIELISEFTERQQILDKAINSFPEGDRFVIDAKKIKYIREDIVLEALALKNI